MNSGQFKLLIRADANPKIGTSQVVQSLALADAWKKHHGEIVFVSGNLPQALSHRISSSGYRLLQIGANHGATEDAVNTLDIASVYEPDWIALFGNFDHAYQKQFENSPARLLVVEDQPVVSSDADLVLNNHLEANPESTPIQHQPSSTMIHRKPKVLCGANYALLPQTTTTEKQIFGQARRILVTSERSDSGDWSMRILRSLSDLNRSRLVVDLVLNTDFGSYDELAEFKRTANLHLRIHRNVDRLQFLAQNVDLAIAATEKTCIEMASCGVPAIVVSFSQNLLTRLGANGKLNELYPKATNSPPAFEAHLRKSLVQLLNDRPTRMQMSQTGSNLIDGKGPMRIVRKMIGECYSFRTLEQPVKQEDSKLLWRWRNDPEVRSASFNQQAIPFGAHQNWLESRLIDGHSAIWIAEDRHGHPVGQVRFDFVDSKSALISVTIDQALRGRGLGTVLIEKASEFAFGSLPVKQIVAQTLPANIASERAFLNAGYETINPTTVNGHLANQFVIQHPSHRENIQSNGLKKTA